MAGSFLEDLGAEDPGETGAGTAPATPEPQPDQETQVVTSTETPSDQSTETPVDSTASQTQEPSQQADDDLVSAQRDAAYWKGKFEAIQGANNGVPKVPELTEEERAKRDDEYFSDPVGYTERLIQKAADRQSHQINLRQSAMLMQREVSDYGPVIAKFQEMVESDPSLEYQLATQMDPARYAYNLAKRQMELEKYGGDLSKRDAEIEKRVRAEMEAKYKQDKALEDAGKTPPTPARASGSAGDNASARNQELDPLHDNAFD